QQEPGDDGRDDEAIARNTRAVRRRPEEDSGGGEERERGEIPGDVEQQPTPSLRISVHRTPRTRLCAFSRQISSEKTPRNLPTPCRGRCTVVRCARFRRREPRQPAPAYGDDRFRRTRSDGQLIPLRRRSRSRVCGQASDCRTSGAIPNAPPCGARAGATLPALRSSDGPRRRGKVATPRSERIADAAGAVFAGKRDPERAPAHTAPADHRHQTRTADQRADEATCFAHG